MTAWGSFARDVPRRNLRSLSFVSWEKEYKRDSEAWSCFHAVSKQRSPSAGAGQLTMMIEDGRNGQRLDSENNR